jgi:hypothetical protein
MSTVDGTGSLGAPDVNVTPPSEATTRKPASQAEVDPRTVQCGGRTDIGESRVATSDADPITDEDAGRRAIGEYPSFNSLSFFVLVDLFVSFETVRSSTSRTTDEISGLQNRLESLMAKFENDHGQVVEWYMTADGGCALVERNTESGLHGRARADIFIDFAGSHPNVQAVEIR